MMSRGAERQLNMELVNIWHKARKQEFCMYFGTDRNRTAGTAYRQTECTGCPQGSPKGFPCPYFTTKGGEFTYQSSFFIKKSNFKKERGNQNDIFYNSSNRCEL